MTVHLTEQHSGYHSGNKQWLDFLQCWQATGEAKLIRFGANSRHEHPKPVFNVKLPNSVQDFYQAYAALGGQFISSRSDDVGLFAPDRIVSLAEYSDELFAALHAWPLHSDDDTYYAYGIEQDTVAGRAAHYEKALVLGKFGEFTEEVILLYPDSRTRDGEYESAILSHAYEFRAPSFAEMMRQLSILETGKKDLMPPYSYQESLMHCSAALALQDVWWK